jgi:hypothetical protein
MSAAPDVGWADVLRRAAQGSAQASVEVLHGARPTLLNAQTASALTSAILAAFVCLAARFRSELAAGQLDLIASALRTAALAFVLRALIDLARSARALWHDREAARATLVLSDHGLLLRVGEREESVHRDELLGIGASEALPSRTLPARPEPLLLTLTPRAGQPRLLELPPYFAPTSEIALARLTRWWGRERAPRSEQSSERPEQEAPEAHYERAARGQLSERDLVVPEGRGYLLRAPYTALLGLVFALDVFLSAGPSRALIAGPVSLAGALSLFALLAWFAWIARRRSSRRGIGMLFTRAELLLRGPQGVVAVPWAQLQDAELKLSARWSPFVGAYPARTLILSTNAGERMVFDRAFFGVPLEVIAVLCEWYREEAGRP